MLPTGKSILLAGSSHHRTPLEVREKISLDPERLTALYDMLRDSPLFEQAVVINTCNRVEIYAVGNGHSSPETLAGLIADATGFSEEQFASFAYLKRDREAIEHLCAVTCGLDSMMVGENEILGQVKSAYSEATRRDMVGPVLHRVFQKSFQSAKWARTHTGISQGQVSLGNICVELAQRIYGKLTVSRTMIVGTGDVGRDVAKAFRSRGVACMTVSSRSPERARAVAREIDGLVLPFDEWRARLAYFDIVIFATSAPHIILSAEAVREAARKRPVMPLFLIDLAVPRDVEAAAADVQNVYLYTFDDLAAMANENLRARETEIARCREGLTLRVDALWQTVKRQLAPDPNP